MGDNLLGYAIPFNVHSLTSQFQRVFFLSVLLWVFSPMLCRLCSIDKNISSALIFIMFWKIVILLFFSQKKTCICLNETSSLSRTNPASCDIKCSGTICQLNITSTNLAVYGNTPQTHGT